MKSMGKETLHLSEPHWTEMRKSQEKLLGGGACPIRASMVVDQEGVRRRARSWETCTETFSQSLRQYACFICKIPPGVGVGVVYSHQS